MDIFTIIWPILVLVLGYYVLYLWKKNLSRYAFVGEGYGQYVVSAVTKKNRAFTTAASTSFRGAKDEKRSVRAILAWAFIKQVKVLAISRQVDKEVIYRCPSMTKL